MTDTPEFGVPSVLGGSSRLIRMMSEPSLSRLSNLPIPLFASEASAEDLRWVKQVACSPLKVDQCSTPLVPPPPTAAALKALLRHYFPVEAQLFGTGDFKRMDEFWEELQEGTSCLMKRGHTLQRLIEPVVIQLQWKGHFLMRFDELDPGRNEVSNRRGRGTMRLPTTCCRHNEDPMKALSRWVRSELLLTFGPFEEFLEDRGRGSSSLKQKEETVKSSKYPGLRTLYRTHMVKWDVREGAPLPDFEMQRRFAQPFHTTDTPAGNEPPDDERGEMEAEVPAERSLFDDMPNDARDTLFFQESFSSNRSAHPFKTRRTTAVGIKTVDWCWWPAADTSTFSEGWLAHAGRSRQSSYNFAEGWATHNAEKRDGVVQPPSESALFLFFQRCGIESSLWTHESRVDLWRSLSYKEQQVRMCNGIPRIVEELVYLRIYHGARVLVLHTDVTDECTMTLPRVVKLSEETESDAAVRGLVETLGIGKTKVLSLVADWGHSKHIEQREFTEYPGITGVHVYHLYTYSLKDDPAFMRNFIGGSFHSLKLPYYKEKREPRHSDPLPLPARNIHDEKGEDSASIQLHVDGGFSYGRPYVDEAQDFSWIPKEDLGKSGVGGAHLWKLAASKGDACHAYSSILIGLEGSAPHMKSPFNMKHCVDGKPNKLSAVGNRKWQAYRANNAQQIPAEIGGMQMVITKETFKDLIETMELVDLVDAQEDLFVPRDQSMTKELLERRSLERELFKQILGGSGRESKKAIDAMTEYRSWHKTMDQHYAAIRGGKRGRVRYF